MLNEMTAADQTAQLALVNAAIAAMIEVAYVDGRYGGADLSEKVAGTITYLQLLRRDVLGIGGGS